MHTHPCTHARMHITCITRGAHTRTTPTRAFRPQAHQQHTCKSTHAPLAQHIYNTHSAHAHSTHEQHTHNKYTCSQTTQTRQTSRPSQHTHAHPHSAGAHHATCTAHIMHTCTMRGVPHHALHTTHTAHHTDHTCAASHNTICVHTYHKNMQPEHHVTTETQCHVYNMCDMCTRHALMTCAHTNTDTLKTHTHT